jgi:hypothetical protein
VRGDVVNGVVVSAGFGVDQAMPPTRTFHTY